MGTSPLLGGDRPPQRPEGTGTDRLGPSDSSDSGSDIVGADGAVDTDELGLLAEDIRRERGAGADIGDANLDSNTDASGTGERAEAGRDTLRRDAPDIAPDHVVGGSGLDDAELADTDEFATSDEEAEDPDDDSASDADDATETRPQPTRPARRKQP